MKRRIDTQLPSLQPKSPGGQELSTERLGDVGVGGDRIQCDNKKRVKYLGEGHHVIHQQDVECQVTRGLKKHSVASGGERRK